MASCAQDSRLTFSLILEETIDFGNRSVIRNDGETMIGRIENKILAHDGETDETKISTGLRLRRQASIDASQTRSTVSPDIQSIGSAKIET